MRLAILIRFALGMVIVAVAAAGCARSAQSYFERGTARLDSGNVDAAVLDFRRAVEKDPMFAAARVKLAAAYVRQGDPAGALAESVRAADLLPNDADAQLRAGSMLLVAGRAQDALGRADKAVSIDPKNTDALVLRGNVLAAFGQLDAAVEQIQEAIAVVPKAEWLSNLGVLQHSRGRLAEAEAALREAVETDPKSVPAQIALAKFLSGTHTPEEAEPVFRTALTLDPGNVAANHALGNFYVASNRALEAEPYFRRAAAGDDPAARFALADYYARVHRSADALAVLESLAAVTSVRARAMSRAAELLYSDGNKAKAHSTIDHVIATQPAYSAARVIRGRFLLADGNTDAALAEARQAVQSEPWNANGHFLLGLILKGRRDLDRAAASFHEVLRLAPQDVEAQVRLAEVELQRGEFAAATQLAGQAAKRDPRRADAALIAARGLLALGDIDRAAIVIDESLGRFPQIGAVHAQAGLLAMRKGDRTTARKAFEKALTLDPLLVDSLAALSMLDLAQGQGGRARARIEERLHKTPGSSAVLVVAARTWGATGDHAKAEQFLRRAIDADATNFEAYEMLGRLYVAQKRLDAALVEYDRLAARQRGAVGPPTMAALILQAQGRLNEARGRYERLVEDEPRAAVASNNLAWIYANSGEQLDRALELARAAKAALADSPAVNDTLGFVYLKKQLPSLAIPLLRLAVQQQPGEPLFHYHLGLAHSQAGDKQAARKELEQALRLQREFDGANEARELLRSLG